MVGDMLEDGDTRVEEAVFSSITHSRKKVGGGGGRERQTIFARMTHLVGAFKSNPCKGWRGIF